MNIATAECGRYVLDWERLLREVRQAQDEIYTRTARHACVVDLHPDDAKAIAVGMMGQGDAAPVTAIAGVPVWLDRSAIRRRGVALVRQCELPHPTPEDCPHHARSTRRLTSRDIPVSIDLPRPDARARPCGGSNCGHHPSYHGERGCAANVRRRTPGGNTVYEACTCPQWVEPQ